MNRIKLFAFVLLAMAVASPALSQETLLTAFQAADFPSASSAVPGRLKIRVFGQSFALELTPNHQLLSSLPANHRAKIAGSDLFLKGTLAGAPGSWVRLNRIDGHFSGGFFDGSELYLIDTAGGFPEVLAKGLQPEQSIVYRFADLNLDTLIDHGAAQPDKKLASSKIPADYQSFVSHLQEIVALKGAPAVALPVTIVSDEQFSAEHGGNTASVVAGRVNFVDGIFSSQLGVSISLLHHEILSDNDVLVATDSGDLLGGRFDDDRNLVQPGFRQFMVSGAGEPLPFQGVAHLFTGRNLDGSTVGRAYLGVLCSRSFGYGINQNRGSDSGSALVFAHELGHNFDAPHDGENECVDESFNGIMNSRLNGSQQFSACSVEQMSPEIARASCLVEIVENPMIFTSGFEG